MRSDKGGKFGEGKRQLGYEGEGWNDEVKGKLKIER